MTMVTTFSRDLCLRDRGFVYFPVSGFLSCVLAPALFHIVIDWIMSMCANKAGVYVGQSLFTDIDYADDAVLFAEDDAQWTSILESFSALEVFLKMICAI